MLASAGVAVFLGYVGVFGSEIWSSEEVSEAKSRSFPFPSRECHVLHPDHLMFFVMGEGRRLVSCDLFGHCRELMMLSGGDRGEL